MEYGTIEFRGIEMFEYFFAELQEMYSHVELVDVRATYFRYAYIA